MTTADNVRSRHEVTTRENSVDVFPGRRVSQFRLDEAAMRHHGDADNSRTVPLVSRRCSLLPVISFPGESSNVSYLKKPELKG
ncbi:hypothetical protein F2P81_022810 [Scophthalmus maximus]|uniref:Uncharacterized protein n=1 Tax=Scophthalmus maximus TaxID=52904 RepID=A0A6A4S078_SCOMX|nr:hypothetical protein F2P81_022810 [Scophthalmus maximus]